MEIEFYASLGPPFIISIHSQWGKIKSVMRLAQVAVPDRSLTSGDSRRIPDPIVPPQKSGTLQ
jgi:hypothetical protein